MKKFNTLNIVTAAMLCSLAVILARSFHFIFADMALSALFSPMHLPVLLCGILCGPYLGLICGLLSPVISFAVSGMPAFPFGMVPMALELAAYGFFTGMLRSIFVKNPKVNKFSSILALVLAMVIGRLVNAVAGAALTAFSSGTSFFALLLTKFASNFTSTWLGLILQLILIPSILLCMQKGNVLLKYLPDTVKTAAVSNEKTSASADE